MFRSHKKVFFVATVLFFVAFKANAADLYISPASGTYNVGDVIHASILVDSQGASINSADMDIHFPTDLLSVASVSQANSIFTFWVQQPTFSNTTGDVTLSGGLQTPGFNGSSGNIVNVAFLVKKAGIASLSFVSGSVRANDGMGTDVLQDSNGSTFTLNPVKQVILATPVSTHSSSSASSTVRFTFAIHEIPRADQTTPQVSFQIAEKDNVSDIDHYEFQFDGGSPLVWSDDGTHVYKTAALSPGTHMVNAFAYDTAGNVATTSDAFVIAPLPTPTITYYTKDLSTSESFVVQGVTAPFNEVNIYLQRNDESPKMVTVQGDQNGSFTYTSDSSLLDGTYTAWVVAMNSQGAMSLPSDKMTITVKNPPATQFEFLATNILTGLISLIALVVLLILLAIYAWRKFIVLRKHMGTDARDLENEVHKTFDILKDSMSEQLDMLKKAKTKRELTDEEGIMLKQLKKNLDKAENAIQKKVAIFEKKFK